MDVEQKLYMVAANLAPGLEQIVVAAFREVFGLDEALIALVQASPEALVRRFPDDLDRALDLLTRREVIEPVNEGYRFQVELIRRWFARQVE